MNSAQQKNTVQFNQSAQSRFDLVVQLRKLRHSNAQLRQDLYESHVLLGLLSIASAIFAAIVVYDVLL